MRRVEYFLKIDIMLFIWTIYLNTINNYNIFLANNAFNLANQKPRSNSNLSEFVLAFIPLSNDFWFSPSFFTEDFTPNFILSP